MLWMQGGRKGYALGVGMSLQGLRPGRSEGDKAFIDVEDRQ